MADRIALVDAITGRRMSYAALEVTIARTAAGLAARGYGRGDVFGIFAPNSLEYPLAFHGAARLGAVTTTVNPLFTADELATQLRDCDARCLFTIPAFMERARPAAARAGVREIIAFGESEGAVPFTDVVSASGAVPFPTGDLDDVVALPYSSGTTGLPKGVMLTHRNLVANIAQSAAALPMVEGDVVIAVLPFFHIYGLQVILNGGLRSGATLVVLPRFDLETFLRAIQDHRATWAFVVPPIALALAKHPAVDNFDLSSLRHVLSGAAPLSADLARAVTRAPRLPHAPGLRDDGDEPGDPHPTSDRAPTTSPAPSARWSRTRRGGSSTPRAVATWARTSRARSACAARRS